MQILAIETSGRSGSLAALLGNDAAAECLLEHRLDGRCRTAQSLAPTLEKLLADVGWPAKSIELVAVAVGPGSFTGLRIGVTMAKTLAYAVGAQILGVDTLAVLATQAAPSAAPLWTVMDAQRQELFVARFSAALDGVRRRETETTIVAEQTWLDGLRPGERVTGPPLARLRDRLSTGVEVETPDDHRQPTATSVGRVAWIDFQAGRRDDVWRITPHYFRPSAAEEKRGRMNE